jgi:hypothetical protein
VKMKSHPDDFDPYGKDASKATSGKDMVFRFEGGNVSIVPPEEVVAHGLPKKHSKPKRLRRGMGR